MTKGTASQGKMGGRPSHIMCRRCGHRAYNISTKKCAACGYGASSKLRRYSWQNKKIDGTRIV
ncbi:50S ribosomal protein L37e [Candidatus Bathyarchaeota archaeon]|nr:50S ribosomal protein L37e [Candidatus Bathyarchaeota archaeon]